MTDDELDQFRDALTVTFETRHFSARDVRQTIHEAALPFDLRSWRSRSGQDIAAGRWLAKLARRGEAERLGTKLGSRQWRLVPSM